MTNAAPVPFLLDAEADALAERLAEVLLRVLVTTDVAEAVFVLEAVGGVAAELLPCIWFLTVWLKVPVMLSRVKIAEKER